VTGRTNTVLLACGQVPALGDLFTLEMIRGVQMALAERRYSLLLNAPDGADNGVLGVVSGRAVDGVLLMDDDDTAPDPLILGRKIAERGIPCVIIGHRPISGLAGIGSIVIDVEASAEQAARLLVSQGHRKIGFIGSRSPDKLLARFRGTLEECGQTLPDSQIIIAGKKSEQGRLALHDLLNRDHPTPLTAVFARTDSLAAGALQAARQRGLRVPQDLSLIGHDDIPFSALMAPPLTTMKVDCGQVGAAAAEMLLRLFQEKESSPEARVFSPELVLRETVSARRK
jgi:DNA-binding LacI/PurR family transcriptional regulator